MSDRKRAKRRATEPTREQLEKDLRVPGVTFEDAIRRIASGRGTRRRGHHSVQPPASNIESAQHHTFTDDRLAAFAGCDLDAYNEAVDHLSDHANEVVH